MSDLTAHNPTWLDGLPPDEHPDEWLGESADGRHWILRWAVEQCWAGAGFIDDSVATVRFEARLMRNENADFIVRSLPLPATRAQEKPAL